MQRGAILIGVSKTGSLPELQAVERGVHAMQQWAASQKDHGMNPEHVKVITDAKGPITASDITKVVRELVNLRVLDQLVVYFAGHGVNNGYSEYWLLSDAPDDPQAAINVDGSLVLGRMCRIPHIVMLSDACRTASEGIQAQRVSGSLLFPNMREAGLEQPVDMFFATSLGRPALEIRDPQQAAKSYSAIYTDALIEALEGRKPELFEAQSIEGVSKSVIRPWPLKRYLGDAIANRMAATNIDFDKWAPPDARITSAPDSWVAVHAPATPSPQPLPPGAAPAPTRGGGPRPPPAFGREAAAPAPRQEVTTLRSTSQSRLQSILSPAQARSATRGGGAAAAGQQTVLDRWIGHVATSFGPTHFETGAGFAVRGAEFADAFSPNASTDIGQQRDVVRISLQAPYAANVLLTFDNGTGVVLPALRDYVTLLTMDDGELTNVTYEPSDLSDRGKDPGVKEQEPELRELRSVIAASARFGVFRLERADAMELAQRMRNLKAIDPAMAVYAAYAFHELQRRDIVRGMQNYLRRDLHATLFDVALLARDLDGKTIGKTGDDVFPFLPLLSQGWALLPALELKLPGSLQTLRENLVPSLWTLYNKEGVAKLRAAFQTQEIR